MKIIYGKYKGKQISAPQNIKTRPTLQRAKETMFNIIPHHFKVGIVLDLFAGSGQLGLEALSRGASFLIANEIDLKAQIVLKTNLSFLPKEDYKITNISYEDFFAKTNIKKFDYIFVDPPYEIASEAIKKVLTIIDEGNLLNEEGIVIGQIPKNEEIDFVFKNLYLKKVNAFSKLTKIWVYEKK